ncbi:MULE transposase domain containing protein [Nitzschia inconspicua]|uniref:MULE transposase domain containing protein n=1 Tax=Nitzschia inconspicua TaxID=303405 RepID=A0A9K3Q3B5_9STRA|nr:MULE transposase domain containing protein [Nitzschia inconspicua]
MTTTKIVPTETQLQRSSGLHPELQQLYDRSCDWECKLSFEEVDESKNGDRRKHNLCECLKEGNEYMFPAKFHGLAAKEKLVTALKLSALKAGFCLVTGSSTMSLPPTTKRCAERVRATVIRFQCDHGRLHRQEGPKSSKSTDMDVCNSDSTGQPIVSKKNTSAKRPLTRDRLCPFHLTVYMIREDFVVDAGRWFLGKLLKDNRPTCARHRGHIRIAPDLLPKHIRTMSDEEKKLARECSQLHLSATASAALLNIRNELGVAHTPAQLHYMSTQERITELGLALSATNADKLVKSFSNRTDVCWAIMTFDPQAGVLLESTVKGDATTTDPESISCDVTFGTENTKKQLFTLATRDGNNKAFNCGVAYIPNGQAWVFWHCFRYCLKTLWGETVTKRVSLMCTDGCVQEYQAFINNTGEGGTFPNAVHTLCYFHTATLSFNKNVSLPVGTDPEEMHRAIDVVRWFVKSWFFDLESCEEYNHSRSYLIAWLEQGSGSVLTPHIVNSIKTWVTTHLRPLEKMWLNFERLYLCTMDLRTTSISESMHASMKSGFDGVRAGMDTTSSANAVVGKSTRRQKQQQRLNAREQERTVKWSEMPTTRHLTEYCLMKAKEEWDVANSLVVIHAKMDPGEWWVFKEHDSCGGLSAPPGYTRLRRAKVVHQNFLWCSCGLPSRMKYPCRHIYAVTKQVSMNMFGVRWHSRFQHYYGRDGAEDWTAVFDSMMADEFERDNKNGEVINIEGMDFLSEQPESWLSIQDDNNTLVAQGKHLHELTWVQKKVAVKGVPLPEIRMTVEAAIRGTNDEQEPIFEVGTDDDQEPMFEVECHIPDTIHNLQVSQQNAVTSLRHQKNAADAQVTELFRTALNLAGQRSGHIELLKDHLQEVIRKMNSDIASGNEHHKRSSGYAFPETGRSNKRVEKRKKCHNEREARS